MSEANIVESPQAATTETTNMNIVPGTSEYAALAALMVCRMLRREGLPNTHFRLFHDGSGEFIFPAFEAGKLSNEDWEMLSVLGIFSGEIVQREMSDIYKIADPSSEAGERLSKRGYLLWTLTFLAEMRNFTRWPELAGLQLSTRPSIVVEKRDEHNEDE